MQNSSHPHTKSKRGREVSEYREKRTVVQDTVVGSRPAVETRYDSVVNERQGMSGVAIAALVVGRPEHSHAVRLSQQKKTDEDLAQERARTALAQQTPAQPQPVIVNVPPSQPAIVPAPYPVPAPAQPAPTETRTVPSNASVEIDVTSRLQNDEDLRTYAIDVKVTGGTAVLSGRVPNDELKKRAETLAKTVRGVQSIINDIAVRL